MAGIVKLVVVGVLLVHGIGHIMGFLAAWTSVPMGFSTEPWVFSNQVSMSSAIGRVFGLVWLLALAGFLAATVGLLQGQAWWPTLAVLAALISIAVILPWWNTVTPGSKFGALAVDVLVLAALLPGWREQVMAVLV